MAIKFTYGTVGSGKSYDMMCGTLEDFAAGHYIATINLNLKLERCLDALMKVHGLSRYDASRAVANHEAIFTESRFREVRVPVCGGMTPDELGRMVSSAGAGADHRRVKLKADECHFWWPRNSYYKMSIEDVLAAAMSRKRGMDMHLISQLNGQINQDIAGLSSDNWLARPLKVEPFYSGLKLYTRFARAMGRRGSPGCLLLHSRRG